MVILNKIAQFSQRFLVTLVWVQSQSLKKVSAGG
jgi:hypothetical protein